MWHACDKSPVSYSCHGRDIRLPHPKIRITEKSRGTEMKQAVPTAFAASMVVNSSFQRFHTLPVVRELETGDVMALFSCLEEWRMKRGCVLYEAGSKSERTMCLLLEGGVSVHDTSGNVYSTLKPGDVFGLFSFLEDRPHSATVTAIRDVVVLTLKRSYFDLVTLEDPALGNLLLRFLFRLLSRTALRLEVEYAALRQFALGTRV